MNTESKKKIAVIIFAVTTLGIVFARTSPSAAIMGWIPAVVLFLVWGYVFCRKFINKRDFGKLAISIFCIIIASVFVTIPYHTRVSWQQDFDGAIMITATGEKNEASYASEVWVSVVVDGRPISLQHFVNESWELVGNGTMLFSRYGSFVIEDVTFSSLVLDFASHAWTGIVEITTPLGTQRHDLHNFGVANYMVEIPHDSSETALISTSLIIDFIFVLAALFMTAHMAKFLSVSHYYYIAGAIAGYMLMMSQYTNFDFISQGIFVVLFAIIAGKTVPIVVSGRWRKHAPTIQTQFVLFILISYATFASTYNQIVLASLPWRFTFGTFVHVLLFGIFWFLTAFAILSCLDYVSRKLGFVGENHDASMINFFAKIFGIIMFGFSVWIVAMYPANFSPDSVDQWGQATGQWPLNDWHPVIHTMLIRFSLFFYESPFSLVFIQTVAASIIYAAAFTYFRKHGLPEKVLYVFAVLIAIMPPNGFMMATFWKDVGFSIAMLGLAVIIGKISMSNNKPSIQESLLLVIAIFCVAGFRHDGIVPATVAAMLMSISCYKKAWRLLPFAGVVMVMFVRVLIYPVVNIAPTPPVLSNVIPIHAIASVFYRGGDLSEENWSVLTEHIPLEKWINDYNPFTPDPMAHPVTQPAIAFVVSEHNSTTTIIRAYLDALIRNPMIIIRHHLSNSDIRWSVFQSQETFHIAFFSSPTNHGFIQNQDRVQSLYIFMQATFYITFGNILLWRTGVIVILCGFLLYKMWLAGLFRYTLMALPLASSVVAGMIFNGSQDFRYVYPVFLTFPLILLYFTVIMAKYTKKVNKHDD